MYLKTERISPRFDTKQSKIHGLLQEYKIKPAQNTNYDNNHQSQTDYESRIDIGYKYVFNLYLKTARCRAFVMDTGSWFHNCGAAIVKVLSFFCLRQERRTCSKSVLVEQ